MINFYNRNYYRYDYICYICLKIEGGLCRINIKMWVWVGIELKKKLVWGKIIKYYRGIYFR